MKKHNRIFTLARLCKEIIWKCSGQGIYIQLHFDIETSSISIWSVFVISNAFCEC